MWQGQRERCLSFQLRAPLASLWLTHSYWRGGRYPLSSGAPCAGENAASRVRAALAHEEGPPLPPPPVLLSPSPSPSLPLPPTFYSPPPPASSAPPPLLSSDRPQVSTCASSPPSQPADCPPPAVSEAPPTHTVHSASVFHVAPGPLLFPSSCLGKYHPTPTSEPRPSLTRCPLWPVLA